MPARAGGIMDDSALLRSQARSLREEASRALEAARSERDGGDRSQERRGTD